MFSVFNKSRPDSLYVSHMSINSMTVFSVLTAGEILRSGAFLMKLFTFLNFFFANCITHEAVVRSLICISRLTKC